MPPVLDSGSVCPSLASSERGNTASTMPRNRRAGRQRR
jgi:hypothetical protein